MPVELRALVLQFRLTLMAPASATPQLLVSGWDDLRTAPLQTQLLIDEDMTNVIFRGLEDNHSGLSLVSYGEMPNGETEKLFFSQKTKLSAIKALSRDTRHTI